MYPLYMALPWSSSSDIPVKPLGSLRALNGSVFDGVGTEVLTFMEVVSFAFPPKSFSLTRTHISRWTVDTLAWNLTSKTLRRQPLIRILRSGSVHGPQNTTRRCACCRSDIIFGKCRLLR